MPIIVAGMATMPSRVNYLEQVVQAIRPQVDFLRVYLNGFDEVPDFLDPEEALLSEQADGDLGAEGKFYWVDDPECLDYTHYLTIDDDIGYPHDYVERLVDEFDRRDGKAIIGVHGSEFSFPIESFVDSRAQRYRYYEGLEQPEPVHILGTATTLFSRETLDISLHDFPLRNTSDLQLAIAAQNQGVPMIAIPRDPEWMTELRSWKENGFSIWGVTKGAGKSQAKTELAQNGVDEWVLFDDPIKTIQSGDYVKPNRPGVVKTGPAIREPISRDSLFPI